MSELNENIPVVIGVGEASERINELGYSALSPAALAAQAALAALNDARGRAEIATHIELVAGIRQFEISDPRAVSPFGCSNNFPRSVAARIGANPDLAILDPVGGQGPQRLINELANRVGAGEVDLALACGAEAISTVRDLTARGEARDWSEIIEGQLEDRGFGLDGLLTPPLSDHGARTAIQIYALLENARRARKRLDRESYRRAMGELFAPFTRVAATNPHAMSRAVLDAETIANVTPDNRIVVDPFPRRVVSRDQANQGAAVLIASVRKALELGVPQEKWIYLRGGADVVAPTPMERADLSAYPAAGLAIRQATEMAGISPANIDVFDIYSCFPVAVWSVREELGITDEDSRPMTVTGGLPYFGGAGNNYSMHAIAAMVRILRVRPQDFGLVGANGGYLSKFSACLYSAQAGSWKPFSSEALQAEIDNWPAPALAPPQAMGGIVETYMIDHGRSPNHGVVICRTSDGKRLVAMTSPNYHDIVHKMIESDPLGRSVECTLDERGRRVIAAIW